jgi:hypothetical protein
VAGVGVTARVCALVGTGAGPVAGAEVGGGMGVEAGADPVADAVDGSGAGAAWVCKGAAGVCAVAAGVCAVAAGVCAVAAGVCAVAATGAATGIPAIGRSALWPIENPQAGQKWSSLPWIAAQRGQAVTPASRSTVTPRCSRRAASIARSSESMRSSVASLPFCRSSRCWPRRCISKTRPPRSR